MDWLSLFMLILLGTLTYVLTIQGLQSAVIMCVLVLVSTATAFTAYEWVAYSFLLGPLGDVALPAAFMGTFLVPLIALRLTLDGLITRANLLPVLVDRGAGAVVSLFTAFMMTGVLATGLQMVPFGGSFLGHDAIDEQTGQRKGLWLNPDSVAVGYASFLSSGVFSGKERFADAHPSFIDEVAWSQTGPMSIRHVAPPGAVKVVRVETRDYIFDKKITSPARGKSVPAVADYNRVNPPAGKQWYLVRLGFGQEARNEKQQIAFTRRQIRLVGREQPQALPANYSPIAMNDDARPNMAVKVADGKVYMPAEGSEVDFVFEVSDQFVPMFIEYACGARAELANSKPTKTLVPSDETAAALTTPPKPPEPPKPARTDRVSGIRSTGNSRFGDELPITMTKYEQADLEEKAGAIANGHVYGKVTDQSAAGQVARLTKFDVPADKRLLHMEIEQLRAKSLFGKALSFAVTSLQSYTVRDEAGTIYPVSGQYVIADVDGEEIIEIQYFPETVAAANRGGMRPLRRIKQRQLDEQGNRLVFVFLVNPGAKIVEFSTGRAPADLRDLNLVAPR